MYRFVLLVLCLMLPAAAQEAAPAAAPSEAAQLEAEQPLRIIVPAGTKLPVVLKHAINTKTAKPGDNVYGETNFPVVQDNRILIPAGTYVQGSITSVKRPGRLKGRAELLMHFTTLIYPNGYTVAIPGALDQLPGADAQRIKDDEGTIEASPQKGRDVGTAAGTAASGTLIGAAAGGGKGAAIGAGVGGLAGLAITMLTRGNDVVLDAGTTVEMVLQRPLELEEERMSGDARRMVPSPRQGRKLEKPQMMPPPETR